VNVGIGEWVALAAAIAAMLAIDLTVAGRGEQGWRRSLAWSVIWTVAGLGFAAVVWALGGAGAAGEYLAGYTIERSLSIDNLFVFALIFGAVALPAAARNRTLTLGIVLALGLRAGLIAAGAALLASASWVAYVFAAFLVVTGLRLATARHGQPAVPLRVVERLAGGRLPLSPATLAVAAVALADVAFAVDSIPSIFAVTRETYLVVAANAFALVGLRPLYHVLADMTERFTRLPAGIGAVLVLVGLRMAAEPFVHVPVGVTLAAIVAIVAAAVAASLNRPAPAAPAAR
jgi:tellurite resistance protein TerC